TITGEHGVGLAKKPFLPAAVGSVAMDLMQRLKKDFDPVGILNPGKIFD
ncbi:MAG: FAD-linked oxidase C-terminal domain-containing protein, partial [Candidatus Latescibacteria bacterium]|nr:FAD-linked oxidase C-terminal domain-containing protein [Candidatus Latescibacterota bacterium]